jgi:hypothetical protein
MDANNGKNKNLFLPVSAFHLRRRIEEHDTSKNTHGTWDVFGMDLRSMTEADRGNSFRHIG